MKLNKYFLIILLLVIPPNLFLFSETSKGLKIAEIKGNEGYRWALCVGINDYWDEKITDLKKARSDAKLMGEILQNNGQFNKVFVMSDDLNPKDKNYPSKFNIEANINFVADMAKANDLVVIHFSGHGISNKTGESYLLPADIRFDSPFATSVKLDDIVLKFKSKGIKKILLLVDACREELSGTKGLGDSSFYGKVYSESDVAATFYATKQGWYSYEDPKSDYGIFTRFVTEGLSGKADANNDSIVSFSELELYVTKEIYDYAVNIGYKQMPYTKLYGEKFGDLALTSAIKGQITKETVIKENKDISFNLSDLTDKEKAFYDKFIVDKWGLDLNKKESKQILINKKNGFLAGGLFMSIFGPIALGSSIPLAFVSPQNVTLPFSIILFSSGVILTPLSAIPFWYYYYVNNITKKLYSVKVSFNAGYNFMDNAVALNAAFRF